MDFNHMLMAFGCIWPLQFTVWPWKWQVFSGNSSFKPRLMAVSTVCSISWRTFNNCIRLPRFYIYICVYIYTYIYTVILPWDDMGVYFVFRGNGLVIIWGWMNQPTFFSIWRDEHSAKPAIGLTGFQLWPVVFLVWSQIPCCWKFPCHERWLENSRTIHGGTSLGKSWNSMVALSMPWFEYPVEQCPKMTWIYLAVVSLI